ncbi:MAG: hypothetical protein WCR14_06730 [Bacteroidaceae bacterium]
MIYVKVGINVDDNSYLVDLICEIRILIDVKKGMMEGIEAKDNISAYLRADMMFLRDIIETMNGYDDECKKEG